MGRCFSRLLKNSRKTRQTPSFSIRVDGKSIPCERFRSVRRYVERFFSSLLEDADYNMEALDEYEPSPGPDTRRARIILRKVVGWIGVAIEIAAGYERYKEYQRGKIITTINSHYNGQLETTDDVMHNWTGDCAASQARKNAFNDAKAGISSYTYYVGWSGLNQWLGIPQRKPVVIVEGPL